MQCRQLVGAHDQALPSLAGWPCLIIIRRTAQSQIPTRSPPGAHPVEDDEGGHLFLVSRAYHFFSFTISKTRFLSSESASIFFNSLFSFSSSFSRLASGISIIPNLRFQWWNVCSEMFFSRHSSTMFLPPSASRKMGIFSSVVWRLPFMLWGPFRLPRLTPAPVPFQAVTSPSPLSFWCAP